MIKQWINEAASKQDSAEQENLIQQIARFPDEAVLVAINILHERKSERQDIAIRLLSILGFPRNALAIADLIWCVADLNFPAWEEAALVLDAIPVEHVVPYLIAALFDQGHQNPDWDVDMGGLCTLLTRTTEQARKLATQCVPTLLYLLTRNNLPQGFEIEGSILNVLEGIELQQYVLPTLIAFMQGHKTDEEGERVSKIIARFSKEDLQSYELLLSSSGDTTSMKED